jgi:hypothetical protein
VEVACRHLLLECTLVALRTHLHHHVALECILAALVEIGTGHYLLVCRLAFAMSVLFLLALPLHQL